MVYAEILAGGKGTRMGKTERPKQFLMLKNKPILIHTIEQFLKSSEIDKILVCCPKEWVSYTEVFIAEYLPDTDIDIVVGGSTRNETIMNGCKFISEKYGLSSDDKIITLSTCTDDGTKRIVIHAKMVKVQYR